MCWWITASLKRFGMGDEHALHRQCDGFGTSVLDFVFDIEIILLTQMRHCSSSSNKISHSNFSHSTQIFREAQSCASGCNQVRISVGDSVSGVSVDVDIWEMGNMWIQNE